ncbi:hypothetical protein GTO10_00035 [Candidatus Saccharibacteria bacterium]|nr:hypothetical protein [Candidatus Saccharibacteria bacterium]
MGKKERFVAPIDGVLDSLSEEGILRIKKEIAGKEIKAPFGGRVDAASSGSVGLAFASAEMKGSWGSGNKATGYLIVIEKEEGDLFSLDGTCEEQIVALPGELTKGLWYKAISLGAAGFIAGDLKSKPLLKEIEEDSEAVPVIILGIDGRISQEFWAELKKAKGKMVLIDGQQKRVLIPH